MYIFKNANIVDIDKTYRADVLVQNGKVSKIQENIIESDAEIIDVAGKYLLPGCIDVHTHMELPSAGTISSDDFESGTIAAAFGGVTTIVDFASQEEGLSLTDAINKRKAEADGKVVIDYGLTLAITEYSQKVFEEIPEVIKMGCPTFKLFMTYDFSVDDYTLFNVMKRVDECGGMVNVHAENKSLITGNVKRLLSEGKTEPKYHEVSRPDYVEAEAVCRASILAEEANSKLYVVHLSSGKGLGMIRDSRKRGGKVLAETCLQYLVLSKEKYSEAGFGGSKYVMSPPLRAKKDNEELWYGLANGDIQVIGSDHCPFTLGDKKLGLHRFDKIPNGAPGVETSLMLLYSEGVLKNRITLNKLVEVFAYNPAKIFGLKNKGSIEVGKDADIVVFDPNVKRTVSYKNLHTKNDYSPYEGVEVVGVPVLTMSRGEIICEGDKLIGKAGRGKFIKREIN